jgi:hypothetical protein
MPRRNSAKRRKAKTILRLPDLEQSKNAVLHSLAATTSRESYGHAIDEFIGWYCSEPRLAFNRTVVLRYRLVRLVQLDSAHGSAEWFAMRGGDNHGSGTKLGLRR